MVSKTPPSKKTPAKKTPPSGEKKPRAQRENYGFHKQATIRLVEFKEGEEKKYRGQRLDWYGKVQKSNGKTVDHFLEANKGDDPPRGWLRFFVQDGAVTLDASTISKEEPAKK